jgi:two-component system chemotaxis response regulator CheY
MTVALDTMPVMVIDDNDFIREAISVMLTDIGFREIAQARDGNDGLRQLEKVNPGLIICDVSMKPMDGLSFVEALRRQSWPGAAKVPVIFLTVHTESAIVKKAVKLGVKAYVVKPVQKKQLEARILTVLENA